MHRSGIAVAVAAILIAGCTSSANNQSLIGLANPASAYCVEQGGTLTIEDRPGGQVGICTLPDGKKIEEWELFRRDHPKG